MPVAPYVWAAWDGIPLDGSSGNAGPGTGVITGTDSNPKKRIYTYDFDAAVDETLQFDGVCPDDYAAGAVAVDIYWVSTATTATVVRWGAKIGAVTPADTDTLAEHVSAAGATGAGSNNTTEAGRLIKTTLTLSGLDSLAAGDLFWLLIYRDADGTSGTDDLAVDARLTRVRMNITV